MFRSTIVSVPVRGKRIEASDFYLVGGRYHVSVPVRGKRIEALPFQNPYPIRPSDSQNQGGLSEGQILENSLQQVKVE